MYWEAGGTKFARTRDLVVRRNFVHHNRGPGLWTDIDNVRTLYEANRVEDNGEAGILHEISYAAVIRNNVVRTKTFGTAPSLKLHASQRPRMPAYQSVNARPPCVLPASLRTSSSARSRATSRPQSRASQSKPESLS